MLGERQVNNEYTHVLKVKVKKETALLLINEQLHIPIVRTTMVSNAARVSRLLQDRKVPEDYYDTELPKNSQSYSFKFLLLLMAYLKQVDRRKKDGSSPVYFGSSEITDQMLNTIDRSKLIDSFRNKIQILGKNLANYFSLEQIHVSKSSLYNYYHFYKKDEELQKECPNLPPLQYGRVYTPEEVDQWRTFVKIMKERPYKRQVVREEVFVI